MNFTCTQENLNTGLSVVSHIANRNINLPILGNVLIKAEDSMLKLMSTNLEVAVSCGVRGKITEQGEFTVPSRLFSDYVNLLPKDKIDVKVEGNVLAVSCGQYETKLTGMPSSEFPLIPKVESNNRFVVKVAEFRRAVSQVLFAVAPNESRPEISGVLFRFDIGSATPLLTLAATDSYRLAERLIPLIGESNNPEEPMSVIVPSRTVSEVVRILGVFKDSSGNDEELEIKVAEGQILFSYNSVQLVSRIIEGKYPNYQQLIPENFKTEIVISKDELTRAVKATSLFSRSGLNDVHFRFSENSQVIISAMNSQTGEHKAQIDGDVSGSDNQITANFKYFLDGLGNIESDKVLMQMNDGMSPCVLRPVTEDGRSDYLYIVMPIRQ
jgi:DNA polymerase-3 subunit beta